LRLLAGALAMVLLSACASPPAPAPTSLLASRAVVVRTAWSLIGAPYRWGGSSPEGFDCSGLVLHSYRKAGITGLPHSAAKLETMATRVSLHQIEPGDLLFFQLEGPKTSHVGIYLGNREFVHAPSGGKRVEKVGFDHVYWGKKLKSAGRLVP
jgi:murein DD-endopeptidase